MTPHLKDWLKGPLLSAVALVLYSVALGLFISLMLLVIAMEEGGDNISELSVPVTEAVVLLSQGAGFEIGSVRLTIVPLLLTVLLIGVVRSLALRLGCGWRAYLTGLASWLVLNLLLRQGVAFAFVDDLWLILAKCALVFSVGFALAALGRSPLTSLAPDWYRGHVGAEARRTVRIGVLTAAVVALVYLVCGLVTVVVWAVLDWRAVAEVFAMSGMQTGSRVLTTLFCAIWLPNVCIWAVSWLFGGGFAIGELADFSLWVGQSADLPPVPVFGLFPAPVGNDAIRITLMIAPIALGLACGLAAMLAGRGFGIRAGSPDDGPDALRRILEFVRPALAFCLSGALLSVAFTLLFTVSNGSLGFDRLAHVGVDVMVSTRTVIRPIVLGLFMAWLLVAVAAATVYGVRWLMRRRAAAQAGPAQAGDDTVVISAVHDAAPHDAGVRGDAPGDTESRGNEPRNVKSRDTEPRSGDARRGGDAHDAVSRKRSRRVDSRRVEPRDAGAGDPAPRRDDGSRGDPPHDGGARRTPRRVDSRHAGTGRADAPKKEPADAGASARRPRVAQSSPEATTIPRVVNPQPTNKEE